MQLNPTIVEQNASSSTQSLQTLLNGAVESNVEALQSALTLIRGLGDAQYVHNYDTLKSASVGEHVRHILDHYHCFLAGLEQREIDFDARDRDHRCESDRMFAIDELTKLVGRLTDLIDDPAAPQLAIAVRQATRVSAVPADQLLSSPARELAFLHSHTVHHFATIALLLRSNNVDVDENFGIAPSTRNHRNRLDATRH